jgi:hypothetical protein
MSNQAVQSTDVGRVMPAETMRVRAFKPPVLVPLFVGAAIAGAALPLLIGHHFWQRPIDREDTSLCERFKFPSGTWTHSECKAALADMRRQHELLLLH